MLEAFPITSEQRDTTCREDLEIEGREGQKEQCEGPSNKLMNFDFFLSILKDMICNLERLFC
jgi:hypothetical protein